MNSPRLSRVTLAILLVVVLMVGVVLGSAVTALGEDRHTPIPSPSPPRVDASPSAAELPRADVDGEDLGRLPRYPGSVRAEFAVSLDERYRLTAVEYLVDASVDDVRAYYQEVIDEEGWDRADVNYAAGEWTYVLVDGRTEALVEIEEWGGLIEIDLQVSEPISPSQDGTPEPMPEQTTRPAAPPAAPPPGDDDDDGDDESGGDDDTDDGGSDD